MDLNERIPGPNGSSIYTNTDGPLEIPDAVFSSMKDASKITQADLECAFRSGHLAGIAHCPLGLAWKEWQLRENTKGRAV